MSTDASQVVELRIIIDATLRGELTPELAQRAFERGSDVATAAMLAASRRLAEVSVRPDIPDSGIRGNDDVCHGTTGMESEGIPHFSLSHRSPDIALANEHELPEITVHVVMLPRLMTDGGGGSGPGIRGMRRTQGLH